MNTDAQYEYANELLQAVGFSNLADYHTLVKCADLDEEVLERVNKTIPRFRKLFRQRDYNLSRYDYRLQKREHLLGLLKKLTGQLGIGYEVHRHKGKNHLRLKPPNNHLERFIKKMQNVTTGSQLMKQVFPGTVLGGRVGGPVPQELKTKKMSEILEEYGNTDKRTKEYYFYDELELAATGIADVLMSVTSAAPFNVSIGGHTVVKNVKEWKPVLPMFALLYHAVKITFVAGSPPSEMQVPTAPVGPWQTSSFEPDVNRRPLDIPDLLPLSPQFNSIIVHSVGLNKLRFDCRTWRILLDSPAFDTGTEGMHHVCQMGMYGGPPPSARQIPKPPDDIDEHLLSTEEYEIMEHRYKIGESDYCPEGIDAQDPAATAITRLVLHQDKVDGIYGECTKELQMKYCEVDAGIATAYYALRRDADVLIDIQPESREADWTYSLQVLSRKREVLESGLHHPFSFVSNAYATTYYVVSVPVSRITRTLRVTLKYWYLDTKPRAEMTKQVIFSAMDKNGVVEGPDLAKYFAK